jgi:hypothetical protein
MSGLACLFSVLTLACLGLTAALAAAGRRRRRESARANRAENALQTELETTRRVMFGSEFRGDLESSAGCPVCGEAVAVGLTAFIIAAPPTATLLKGGMLAMSYTPAQRASAHVMRFEPCGCVWDSTVTSRASPYGLDLVCVVDGETGRTRFGLATRDESSIGEPTIITEVRGAGGERAL